MSSPKSDQPCGRLLAVRKRLGKRQGDMAAALAISLKGYQRYESGERAIPANVVDRLSKFFGIDPDWLWDGTGEMFPKKAHDMTEKSIDPVHKFLPAAEPRGSTMTTKAFGERYRAAVHLVDEVLAQSRLQPTALMREALRTLAYSHQVSPENLVLLVNAIEQQAGENKA